MSMDDVDICVAEARSIEEAMHDTCCDLIARVASSDPGSDVRCFLIAVRLSNGTTHVAEGEPLGVMRA